MKTPIEILPLGAISAETFRPYGKVIEWQGDEKKNRVNQFRICVRDCGAPGWRIAYLIVRERTINRLERHPCSWESFEPFKGKSLLFVSNQIRPSRIAAFVLNKPVVLRKGIWHGIVAVSAQAEVKITENNRVKLQFYRLGVFLPQPPSKKS